jgi:uncharacterized protein (TIGR00255 family)
MVPRMRSMTGFGTGEAALGAGRVIVEARSVNNRFVDVRVNVPEGMSSHAAHLEQRVRRALRRGRVDVTVRHAAGGDSPVHVDAERARALYVQLAELRDELAPGSALPVTAVLQVPGVLRAADDLPSETQRAALSDALDAALGELEAMRAREGEALCADLASHLAAASELVDGIEAHAGGVVVAARERLRTRIRRLLDATDQALDEGRLEQEVAVMADKSDISEELARLRSHVAQFTQLSGDDGPLGRKLEFLLQEMGRETNTIGSKSQDAGLTQRVVELKATLERMREQILNVE